ncbi:hypothetical protein [Streptomyces sp. NPDC059176]|uniref:hypothetical protein n=1 Tax=unclassified Streptomyces TaxID=2593676 RepID=UPI003697D540
MYEMWMGKAEADGHLVWHVVDPGAPVALCGQARNSSADTAKLHTDRHCVPCMVAFQAIMNG